MPYTPEDFDKEISTVIEDATFNETKVLDSSKIIASNPEQSLAIVRRKMTEITTQFINHSNALSPNSILENISNIGKNVEKLDNKLQANIRMLKQNEGLMSCTSSILEFDTAKTRTDTLVKVLKAKIQWVHTYKELQLIDKSETADVYQKLVTLQQCYDILSEYFIDETRQMAFEKTKDEFLSWKGSATLFCIKDHDFQKLADIEECYRSLGRVHEFRRIFGLFARNEFKDYLNKRSQEENSSIWNIFEVLLDIWKHIAKMGRFINDDDGKPFEIVSNSLYEIALENWDSLAKDAFVFLESFDDPLKAARDIAKDRQSVLSEIENCSDSYFASLLMILFDKVNQSFGQTYSRIVTSALLRAVNVIEMPLKGSRRKGTWFPPQLEPLQTVMMDIVHNASFTFGTDFAQWIVPSLEHAFRELHAKMTNNDFFRLNKTFDIEQKQSTDFEEVAQNELTFIVGIGSVLQLHDTVNHAIQSASKKSKDSSILLSNRNLLERLNKKVVQSKAAALAKSISTVMVEGMNEMKTAVNPVHSSAVKLPRFSRAPHNYILGVGHGFLSQMKVISSYSNESSFINSVVTAAGGKLTEDEAGIWFLNRCAEIVMNSFCEAVGDLNKLPEHVMMQLKADIGYFIDAAKDLRLEITPELTNLNDQLGK